MYYVVCVCTSWASVCRGQQLTCLKFNPLDSQECLEDDTTPPGVIFLEVRGARSKKVSSCFVHGSGAWYTKKTCCVREKIGDFVRIENICTVM